MAYQLSTVRTRIQAKLDNTAFDQTKLTQFVNDGQRDIFGTYKFPFMEREADLTTTIGSNATSALPAAFQSLISLRRYTPSDTAGMMKYVEYEDFDERHPNPTVGDNSIPTEYTIFNGAITVFPKSDVVHTLKLKYYKEPAELVNDSDVPEIPEEYSELLVLAGYKRALMHDDNFDQAQVVQQDIDGMAQAMILRLSKRATGQVHVMRSPRNLRRR